jgi:glutamyl/glutaminyl-tRNA synthetase
MIGDSDGGKFSKRMGSLSIDLLRNKGYLPQGIMNYLALLGWSPGDTSETGEKFSHDELVKMFSLERVNKSRALFDQNKLDFLNSSHLQDISAEDLAHKVQPKKKEWHDIWAQALDLVKHDASTLEDLRKIEEFLEDPKLDESDVAKDILKKDTAKAVLSKGVEVISGNLESNTPLEEAVKSGIKQVGKELSVKGKELFFPFRVAITGKGSGPELVPLAKVIGQEAFMNRLRSAAEFANS